MNDFNVGDVVAFVNQDKHYKIPQWYPRPGTKGEILEIKMEAIELGDEPLFVQWAEGTTTLDDRWYCDFDDVVKEARK